MFKIITKLCRPTLFNYHGFALISHMNKTIPSPKKKKKQNNFICPASSNRICGNLLVKNR